MRATIAFVVLLLIPTVSGAQGFTADLVPRPGTGSSGSGSAVLTLSGDATTLAYTIQFSGLTGPEIAAHIHRPDGTIAHPLPLGSPKVGTWQNIGFADQVSLQLGQLYILIHTNENPGGELRGNIVTAAVPVEPGTWGAIKALYD